uniref:N-acetyltransferase domain-containing protein n=1 Tax=Mesocestoides corti TaxID=53468 RepID=A0A5K3G2S9_MESCO
KDWYNRTGFIDQSEARATRQAPSIRVHRAGHTAPYKLHLSRVIFWLAAHRPQSRRDRGLAKVSVVQYVCVLHIAPKPHVRCLSFECTTLATLLIIYCTSFVSISGLLLIFFACHWYTE